MIDRRLPLIDLHRHLEGCVRFETMLELAAQHGLKLPGDTVATLRPHVLIPGPMAGLALAGLMHAWKFTASDTVISVPLIDLAFARSGFPGWARLFPAWPYAVGYALLTALLLAAHRWAKATDASHD